MLAGTAKCYLQFAGPSLPQFPLYRGAEVSRACESIAGGKPVSVSRESFQGNQAIRRDTCRERWFGAVLIEAPDSDRKPAQPTRSATVVTGEAATIQER